MNVKLMRKRSVLVQDCQCSTINLSVLKDYLIGKCNSFIHLWKCSTIYDALQGIMEAFFTMNKMYGYVYDT
jgi:hypothetical protein